MRRRFALLSLLLCAAVAAGAAPRDREAPLRQAVWGGRWLEGVRLYGQLEKEGITPSSQASYLAGLAQWKLRRPEAARPLLEEAAAGGFRAGGGRLQPDELLAKIDAYVELRPARVEVPGSSMEVYAEARTPLTAPILDALPRIEGIGLRIFGEKLPIRFVLFARLPRFERFFALLSDSRAPRPQAAHSTGVVNMVVFCEERAHRATTDETVSLALHEAMHAWAATYLRRKYDRPILLPPYVDEGLATYAAGLWSPEAAAIPAERWARRRAHGFAAPTFAELRARETFYAPKGSAPNYWLAERLIERLIGPPETGAAKIKAFLDAYAATGDDLAAWREVSGKDAAAEYAALVAGD